MHQFTETITRHDMGDVHFAIVVVPPEIVADLHGKSEDRVLVSFNGAAPIHRKLLSLGEGRGHYLLINAELQREHGVGEGDSLSVKLEPDTSEYGMPFPAELEALLAQEEAGRSAFEALKPGQKRRILYVVGQPKREATRMKKAVVALEYLLQVGPEGFDYPDMVAFMKGR